MVKIHFPPEKDEHVMSLHIQSHLDSNEIFMHKQLRVKGRV